MKSIICSLLAKLQTQNERKQVGRDSRGKLVFHVLGDMDHQSWLSKGKDLLASLPRCSSIALVYH